MNTIFNGPLEKKIVSQSIWITIIFNDPLDSRVPILWDLLFDELRWNLCNNRNQVRNKCDVLESFWNQFPPQSAEKLFHEIDPWCQKGWGLLL